jgi:hypothetical protein
MARRYPGMLEVDWNGIMDAGVDVAIAEPGA